MHLMISNIFISFLGLTLITPHGQGLVLSYPEKDRVHASVSWIFFKPTGILKSQMTETVKDFTTKSPQYRTCQAFLLKKWLWKFWSPEYCVRIGRIPRIKCGYSPISSRYIFPIVYRCHRQLNKYSDNSTHFKFWITYFTLCENFNNKYFNFLQIKYISSKEKNF